MKGLNRWTKIKFLLELSLNTIMFEQWKTRARKFFDVRVSELPTKEMQQKLRIRLGPTYNGYNVLSYASLAKNK